MNGYTQQSVESQSIDWHNLFVAPLKELGLDILSFIPDILVAVVILFVGWVVARVLEVIAGVFLRSIHFDPLAEKLGIADLLGSGEQDIAPHIWFARLVFWVTIFTAIVMGLDQLRLRIASRELDQFFFFVFRMFSALIIFLIGLFMSFVSSSIVGTLAENLKITPAKFYAGLVKWTVIVFSFIAGLFHIGLPPEILLTTLGIGFVTLCITFAIAFGWGGVGWAAKVLDRTLQDKQPKS